MRRIAAVLCLLLAASWAEAKRTPARACRTACAPAVSALCPGKGKALRRCRGRLVRVCRRQGVAACAIVSPLPPGTGSTPTTTSLPAATVTTTTLGNASPTTTTLAPTLLLDGRWTFASVLAESGCGLEGTLAELTAGLEVRQSGADLTGSVDGAAASGSVHVEGWTLATAPDCRPFGSEGDSCCLTLSIAAGGFGSPSPADGVATVTCEGGSRCRARWAGSVSRAR